MKTAGWRNRDHPSYWAFLVHRVSGLLLSLFLPLHFWALGQALAGEAALDGFLRWTERPLVKASEVALVFLLAAHLAVGIYAGAVLDEAVEPLLHVAAKAGISICVV